MVATRRVLQERIGKKSRRAVAADLRAEPAASIAAGEEAVFIGPLGLPGQLAMAPDMNGLVVFVPCGWSGQLSGHDRYLSRVLQLHRLSTLQFDLLTESEARDERCRLDIALQASRLVQALEWLNRSCACLAGQRCGLLGSGTGAAVALAVAARAPGRVAAIASLGGRPELAAERLVDVQAPTLLLVGGKDGPALAVNLAALRVLRCEKRLEVIPGAGRRFEQPGALDSLATLAAQWMEHHLARQFLT